jgi:SNF2 family DNA or RNA helicase
MLKEENLHNYQVHSVGHIIQHKHAGLFLQMGLGKTVSTLTAINQLMYSDLSIDSVLIVAPKRVAESVWDAEIANWEHLQHLTVSKITGNEKQRLAALYKKADIHIIGRDNIAWLIGLYGGNSLPFDMLVIDESSSFKNPKSIRFKSLRKVQPSFDRVVILTGTPAPNNLIDLWAQVYLLDRGERLGKFITRFREGYFSPGQRNGAIVYNYNIQKDGEQRIFDKIKDICISMKTEDYLELPGVMFNDIEIRFPKTLQDKYDEFEREQVLELAEADVSAINAAALSNKLLQFANGAIYDEDRNVHEVHTLKLDEAAELVDELGGKPLLIAWTYQHDRDRLIKKLAKYKPVELKDQKTIDDWNAGKIQVLLMHPASGGHGLNIQYGGENILWFGQTWSLELYQQLNARLDRQGKTGVTMIHRLIASKTMDQDVIKALDRKDKGQNSLMDAVKAKIKRYESQRNR